MHVSLCVCMYAHLCVCMYEIIVCACVQIVDRFVSIWICTLWACLSNPNDLLSPGLLRNRTLITLEVGSNALSDTAAGYICEVLKNNVKLEGLSLWQNNITGDVSEMFCSILKNLTFSSSFLFAHSFTFLLYQNFFDFYWICNYFYLPLMYQQIDQWKPFQSAQNLVLCYCKDVLLFIVLLYCI